MQCAAWSSGRVRLSEPRNDLASGVRVRRLAASANFDVVHAHYGLAGLVAAFQPLPLVVSFCGDDLLGTPDGRGGITLENFVSFQIPFGFFKIISPEIGFKSVLKPA